MTASKKSVSRPNFEELKNLFRKELEELFDIGKIDAIELMKNDRLRRKSDIETDIKFYNDQKGPRQMEIGSEDTRYAKKVAHNLGVKIAKSNSYAKEKAICAKQFESVGEKETCSKIQK